MRDVVRWAHTREEFEVRALLSGVPDHDEAQEVFHAFTELDERVASSIAATEQQLLAVFDNPSALASVDGGQEERADFGELLADDATPYVIAPVARQQLYAPLISAVLGHVATAAIERHVRTDVEQRLLVLVDEAGTVGKLPDLPQLSSIAAGCGIQLVTIFHNPGQITATYGPEASTVQSNSETVVFLRGRDAQAAALLDELIGDEPGPDLPSGTGVTRLRRIPPGHAVLVRGFDDARLIRLLSPDLDPDLRLELEL